MDQSQIAVSGCFPQLNPIFQYWIIFFCSMDWICLVSEILTAASIIILGSGLFKWIRFNNGKSLRLGRASHRPDYPHKRLVSIDCQYLLVTSYCETPNSFKFGCFACIMLFVRWVHTIIFNSKTPTHSDHSPEK